MLGRSGDPGMLDEESELEYDSEEEELETSEAEYEEVIVADQVAVELDPS